MSQKSAEESASRAPVVVGLGELLWDETPSGRRWGGAPANFACHAAQLGAEAWVVSAVGDDDEGVELVDATQAHGVRPCVTRVANCPTGRVDVKLGVDGDPTFHIAADSAWDHLPWTDAMQKLAARTDAVCFGTLAQRHEPSRSSIHYFLEALPEEALRIFDANLRAPYFDKEVVSESLERADVLKVNDQEWSRIVDWFGVSGDFGDAGRALCDRFDLRWVVETLGAKGSRMVGPSGELSSPAVDVASVDTVGAGDAFAATCCLGWRRGADPAPLLAAAARVAAFVCTCPGGAPRLPAQLVTEVCTLIGAEL